MGFEKRLGASLETIVSDSTVSTTMQLIELSVPNQQEWAVLAIYLQYITTNAGASVRQIRLRFGTSTVSTDMFLDIAPGLTQDSALTYNYNFFPGAADLTAVRDTDMITVPIPGGIVLGPGDVVQVEDVSSGDTVGDLMELRAWVEKFRTLSTA